MPVRISLWRKWAGRQVWLSVLGLEDGHLQAQVVLELRTEPRTSKGCIMDQEQLVSCCFNTSLLLSTAATLTWHWQRQWETNLSFEDKEHYGDSIRDSSKYILSKNYNKTKTLPSIPILTNLTVERRVSLVLPVAFSESWERELI